MFVAKHLNFDVARIDDEFLDEDAVVAERRFGLRFRAGVTFSHFLPRSRDPHAFAAAAGGGLDHDRIADFIGDPHRLDFILDDPKMAGHRGYVRGGRCLLALYLVAHGGDSFGIGTDENDPRRSERARKSFALGQKPIPRVDCLSPAAQARCHDFVDDKVTLRGRRRPDGNRGVRHLDMQRVLVGIGINRDSLDLKPARRLDDTACYLATVGDQNPLEHRASFPTPTPERVGFAANGSKCQFDIRLSSDAAMTRQLTDQPAPASRSPDIDQPGASIMPMRPGTKITASRSMYAS